jgi:rsbT co-antagonist protein RsbR
VVEHGVDFEVTEWNEGAEQIFGYTKKEAIGRSLVGLIPSDADAHAWRRLHEGESDAPRIFKSSRKDGSIVLCEWSHEAILDEHGQVWRMLCIGHDVTARIRSTEQIQGKEMLLRAILRNLAIVLCAYDRQGIVTFQDGKGLEPAGLAPGQLVGMNIFDLYTDPNAVSSMRSALAGQPAHTFGEAHGITWETWFVPTRDDHGELAGMISVTLDASEAKRREDELRAKLTLIERQQKVIRELSTPIIEVWDRVLTLPMVGVIDSTRTAELMGNLLEAVVSKRARYAILDLTGVEAVDTKTASYIIDLIRAIRLLGAEGIITGIRPNVAQTMVTLGLDLTGIATRGNLRTGLKLCMQQMQDARETEEPDSERPRQTAR